jgi:Phage portal protein, SPP1 Gp6-like
VPSELEVLQGEVKRLGEALDRRASEAKTLDDYRNGIFPLPPFVQDTGLTNAYRTLMDLSGANWPGLIVGAVEERLEVQGIRFGGDKSADVGAWDLWQEAGLDAESSVLHDSVLTTGRGFAQVWGDGSSDPEPKITLEHASMCIVEYFPGSHGVRKQALRRWTDGKHWFANLYTPNSLFKFVAESSECPTSPEGWKPREDTGDEEWPLVNPLGVVPVVEFAVNRS